MTKTKHETETAELKLAAEAAYKAYKPTQTERNANISGVDLQKLDDHTAPVPHENEKIGFIAYTQTSIENPREVTINIRGTDDFKDGLADLGLLRTWMESPVFGDLVEVAAEKIKNGGHVRSIGHSAGGAAAEALCYQAVAMAGPKATGSCTVHNINGPGVKETLEAVLGSIDPQVAGRIKGVAHRNAKDEVSLFGTHIVPSATYPAPPVFPWAPPAITHHSLKLFREKIAIPGVRPTSVKFAKTPYPTATSLAVKIGPTSTSLLTGNLPQAEMAENIADRVWDKLGSDTFSLFSNETRAFAIEAATNAIAHGKEAPEIVAQISRYIEDGKANGYQTGTIAAADAVAEKYGLSGGQAAAFALEAGTRGADWLEAALASEEDRKMHEKENAPSPKPSPSITNAVEASLNKAGYFGGNPQAIANDYAEGRAMGLNHEDALDHAYGEARQAADVAALERASKWNAPAKNQEEHFSNLVEEAAKEGTDVLAGLVPGSGKPQANGPQMASLRDIRPDTKAIPAPDPKPTKPSKPVSPEIAARRDAITRGMQTWGIGGSVEGLKQAERRANAERVQEKIDARRAAQTREDAAKQQQAEKAEKAAENHRQRKAAQEEQIKNVSPKNQPTFGRNPFEKADPAEAAKQSEQQTRNGFSKHTPLGGIQHGAEDFVPAASAKAAAERRAATRTGATTVQSTDRKVRTGGSHESKGRSTPQAVTSKGGVVTSAGGVVTTGGKKGAGEYNGGRHGQTDNVSERVVCTELAAQGLLDPGLYFLDVRFTEERLSAAHVRGYHVWAVPLVRLMRKSEIVTRLVAPVARWRAEEIAHVLGAKPRGCLAGKIVRLIGEPLCRLIGAFVAETDHTQLYETETVQ